MLRRKLEKWSLAFSIMPIVLVVVALKYIYHANNLEVLSLGPLMSGLIAADVFLLSFLISAILMDYKEAERLPGELAAFFAAIFDEISIIYRHAPGKQAQECLEHVHRMIVALIDWFNRVEHTDKLMDEISDFADYLAALPPGTDPNAVVRMKDQQSLIRRTLVRVRTIRGTFFVPSGYAIAEAMNILVIVGLLATQIGNVYEGYFFVSVIAFLVTYMLVLIRELDNPFNYYSKGEVIDEVSLLPLIETKQRMAALIQRMEAKEPAPSGERAKLHPAEAQA